MIIHDVEQNTEEWLLCRLGKFTASNAHTIKVANIGLQTLCLKLVAERMTGKIEEGYKSPAMERGHELEEMAANAYELETGTITSKVGFCELDEDTGASPDRLIGDDGLLEIKCKTDVVYLKELFGCEIDQEHESQMQMQMYVTNRQWCDYVVYNPNFKQKSLIIKRINRDEVAIEKIKAGIETGKAMIKTMMDKLNG